MKRIAIGLLALLLPSMVEAQPTEPARPHIDILQIWANFIASSVAAHECSAVDPAQERKFLVNLTDVTIRATQRIKERDPSLSDADVSQRMKLFGDDIHGKVEAEIKANSCTSPKIQQLLKLYVVQAEMKL